MGPRQVGKTTLLENENYDFSVSLLLEKNRLRYEQNPDLLLNEIEALNKKNTLIFIDEIQLVPKLLNTIQYIIDKKMAQFVLTGSSARKIRREGHVNLLPGRLVVLYLDALSQTEHHYKNLEDILIYGELPGFLNIKSKTDKNNDLESYVLTYLEEEIRKETATKNIPAFYRFLELAALEAGKIISLRKIGSEASVTHATISSYYEILEDSMIVKRIDPYSTSATRKKLTKSSKYIFFDMGVRRSAAKEGQQLGKNRMGELFEHYVGLELLKLINFYEKNFSLSFWRDPNGPEVDWLLINGKKMIPIEVKYKENITPSDIRHLETFLNEYPQAEKGYVICLSERAYKINNRITALPWNQLENILTLKN